ncbi:MAG: MFS transporter [Nitrosomonadaceae bacterium]|nr:MFS transporter [Nitrosomonadaceae bacterium]
MTLKIKSRYRANGLNQKEIWSWAMYDFANSGYTTSVITTIFSAYFVAIVANNQEWATFLWTGTLAISYLLIILTAPMLGAYADICAAKKRFLFISTVGCIVFTGLLFFVGSGDLWLAMALIIIANFFFGTGENLIAAFLPELAQGKALGRISGWGTSLGFIGGLVSLGCSLVYVIWAEEQGQKADQFVPVTMLITSALFALFCIPTFFYLKEGGLPQSHPASQDNVHAAFKRLSTTIKGLSNYRDLLRFLICLIFYQAGIQTVIVLAAVYAQQAMHFNVADTMLLVIAVNITAALGALIFGNIQDKIGHIPTIALTLFGWIIMILLIWTAESRPIFWLAANIAGLCLGASQSAGRALVGFFTPPLRYAEFFGLWGLAVKFSSIIGPITYGIISWFSSGNHRLAMLLTGSYFIIGLIVLVSVDVRRGRRSALHTKTTPSLIYSK